MFTKKTIRDIDLDGKTVLLRADYNVPVQGGRITDDYRIKQSLPTIEYLLKHQVRLIICSHLGRPKGPNESALSLFPAAKRLKQLLDRPVEFVTDAGGPKTKKAVSGMKPGDVLLLENLRFFPGEKADDGDFAKELASLADVFVQDGFAVAHRKDASTHAVTRHLPSVAGLLLEKEVKTITQVMEAPKQPVMAIVGGAKISDKLDALNRFIDIADFVAIGGAMANTFLAAQGIGIGASLYDKDGLSMARDILKKAEAEAAKRPFVFAVPHDGVVATAADKKADTRVVDWGSHVLADIEHYPKPPPASASQVHARERILDIGPFSASFIAGAVQMVNTVIWNGTLGVTEVEGLHGTVGPFAHGTQLVTEALLGDLGHKPFTVVGGGDTVGYVESRDLGEAFDHVSTGGGASLELMSGHELPAVEALLDKK
ncbi:MAG TPA: phosphoglycerate kinase [Candidatus Saccharimonadales bacterium]|nr:phosphoglycerate kinase [Candidatus Saccharimonadales bacterium]